MKKPTAGKSRNRFRPVARPRRYAEDEIALSNAKVNIHIRLEADVIRYFKERAARAGGKYQSLINQHLRNALWPGMA